MKSIQSSRLLKFALRADAAVSSAVAALQLLLVGLLAEALQLPRALLADSGGFLVAYAILLLWLAGRAQLNAAWIVLIIVGNMAWAFACVALWFSHAVSPSLLGTAFLLLQTVVVLAFAVLEFKGLRTSPPAAPRFSSARSVS